MQEKAFSKRIASAALSIKAIIVDPVKKFTWAKGWKTPIYNDNRKHLGFPENRDLIIDGMKALIAEKGLAFDGILGTSTAGIPWATLLADACEVPVIVLSPEKTAYGFPPRNKRAEENCDLIVSRAPYGIPLGIRIADTSRKPFAYIRPKKKDHGLENQIEGAASPGQKICLITEGTVSLGDVITATRTCVNQNLTLGASLHIVDWKPIPIYIGGMKLLVIEDLISTGGSSLEETETARGLGASVTDIISIFNYAFPVALTRAEETNVSVHSLCTYADVLEEAISQNYVSEEHFAILEEWSGDPILWSNTHGGTDFALT